MALIGALRSVVGGTLFVAALLRVSHSQADTLITYLSRNATEITEGQLLQELQNSAVISFGETHEDGLEKLVINSWLTQLPITRGNKVGEELGAPKFGVEKFAPEKFDCVVETYENLVEKYESNNRLFQNFCNSLQSLKDNGPYATTFKPALENLSFTDRRVLTYSGFRHILPWGSIYPADFKMAFIDQAANNTISTQLPKQFNKMSMTSLSFIPRDNLVVERIRRLIAEGAGKTGKKLQETIGNYNAEISQVRTGPLQFSEETKIFNLAQVQSKFKFENPRIVIIDHKLNIDERVKEVFSSPLLIQFLESLEKSKWSFAIFSHRPMKFGGKNLPVGMLLLYGAGKDGMSKFLIAKSGEEVAFESHEPNEEELETLRKKSRYNSN